MGTDSTPQKPPPKWTVNNSQTMLLVNSSVAFQEWSGIALILYVIDPQYLQQTFSPIKPMPFWSLSLCWSLHQTIYTFYLKFPRYGFIGPKEHRFGFTAINWKAWCVEQGVPNNSFHNKLAEHELIRWISVWATHLPQHPVDHQSLNESEECSIQRRPFQQWCQWKKQHKDGRHCNLHIRPPKKQMQRLSFAMELIRLKHLISTVSQPKWAWFTHL